MPYNRFNAFVYQLIEFIERFNPGFIHKPWISKIRLNCRDDWSEFRTQITMKELDADIDELMVEMFMESIERKNYIYKEEPSDGSEAQELLGGPMQIKAPWTEED